MGGHLGRWRTFHALTRDYWWPTAKEFTNQYVKGCTTCQQNKSNTYPINLPLNPIWPNKDANPFSTISIDLITKLPVSDGFDSILTVMDQGCTKAIVLILCREAMGVKDLAKLYITQAFPFIGIPSKLISDHDTCLTSKMFKEICDILKIKQNLSLAYHPQTDGQSK